MDENTALLPNENPPSKHGDKNAKRRHALFGITLAALFLLFTIVVTVPALYRHAIDRSSVDDKTYDYSEIPASEKLEWYPCYPEYGLPFKCARLTVAMDYHRPLNQSPDHPKVNIALLMLPGKHSGSEKASKSPLLLNPGGPGGSGVAFLLGWASKLQVVLGDDQDYISFDPRGIGATTPRADCFAFPPTYSPDPDNENIALGFLHRQEWLLQGVEIGTVNSTSRALQKHDARSRTIGKLCQQKDALYGNDSILKYVHTPSVARDMLSIVDAWDEWTDGLYKNVNEAVPLYDQADPLETRGKLVYWGFSYGTLLGATFASMFPDRVGRIILDGVVDADLYVAPVWRDSITDADTIVEKLFMYCHKAGPQCVLGRTGDTEQDIKDRFQSIMSNLKENPISLIDPATKALSMLHYDNIRMLLFTSIYFPSQTFPILANILDILHRGDESEIQATFRVGSLDSIVCGPQAPASYYPGDAQIAIMCSDKRYPLNETVPNLEAIFEKVSKDSTFADVWMTIMVGCDGYGIKPVNTDSVPVSGSSLTTLQNDPPMRWDDQPSHKQKPMKTAFPLLFIGNRYDPVTPLKAAVKMAGKFVDAGLIEQESEGHCSISSVSKCTINKIRAYFKDGKVSPPPKPSKEDVDFRKGEWDKCEADEWPWHPFEASTYITEQDLESAGDARILSAWKDMQVAARQFRFWGQPDLPIKTRERLGNMVVEGF
ncbi:hypothetical protein BP5796_00385 [Coleophoma crateriformis]|uniref:Peptidase S33 tripeptidyl aminopeptidase-like C-terminal domain-containing protein n=1 Tax=Coleophoma crateriformis TaxID=565419 RepID=A0A3D8T7Q6_9HELO|nr:hypothetical protein BP5796_00385 [Coleophoma crateriformis]